MSAGDAVAGHFSVRSTLGPDRAACRYAKDSGPATGEGADGGTYGATTRDPAARDALRDLVPPRSSGTDGAGDGLDRLDGLDGPHVRRHGPPPGPRGRDVRHGSGRDGHAGPRTLLTARCPGTSLAARSPAARCTAPRRVARAALRAHRRRASPRRRREPRQVPGNARDHGRRSRRPRPPRARCPRRRPPPGACAARRRPRPTRPPRPSRHPAQLTFLRVAVRAIGMSPDRSTTRIRPYARHGRRALPPSAGEA